MSFTKVSVAGIGTTGTITFTNVNVAGVITATSFSGSGANLTGVASTDNIRTNTNATFLQNINVTGIVTASGANVSGVSTFGNTVVGGGTTQLIVTGDARITGILTIGTGSITLDGSNNQLKVGTGVTITTNGIIGITSINDGPLAGTRNRIINGDMRIDQRNAGAAVTISSTNVYTVDRWASSESSDATFTVQQDSSAPTGFINSAKITVTVADASVAASQYNTFSQRIEGLNCADLAWGTASAATVTLSFWVRSSVTGTFGGALDNSAYNRSYPFTYTISAANTWEQKSIAIEGDTSGTWLTTNGIGITVYFDLGTGVDNTGTANAWVGAGNVGVDSTVQLVNTLNATWYITGVQLEAGSVATPFERRSFGQELALCQRYTFRYSADGSINNFAPFGLARYYGTNDVQLFIKFPCTMRTSPSSLTQVGSIFVNNTGFSGAALTSIVLNEAAADGATVTGATTTGITAGNATTVYSDNASNAALIFSAEL